MTATYPLGSRPGARRQKPPHVRYSPILYKSNEQDGKMCNSNWSYSSHASPSYLQKLILANLILIIMILFCDLCSLLSNSSKPTVLKFLDHTSSVFICTSLLSYNMYAPLSCTCDSRSCHKINWFDSKSRTPHRCSSSSSSASILDKRDLIIMCLTIMLMKLLYDIYCLYFFFSFSRISIYSLLSSSELSDILSVLHHMSTTLTFASIILCSIYTRDDANHSPHQPEGVHQPEGFQQPEGSQDQGTQTPSLQPPARTRRVPNRVLVTWVEFPGERKRLIPSRCVWPTKMLVPGFSASRRPAPLH